MADGTKPVRLQLSRTKGFSLQQISEATNGLPAVNVARPSKYGNPVIKQDFDDLQAIYAAIGRPPIEGTWQYHAMKCFDAWIGGEIPELDAPPTCDEIRRELQGKNLACWCKPGDPCHADVLLFIANDAGEAKP
ncbi:DUF4326 domain-containing protein [Sinorhizobium sp. NFACC03]|uniref:DUF4326 domain-containing protein n=1 Tax=Sinorhizobium sp. NFACC03 TaxID=1566295 RepID=UPI0008919A47|nr:DUF4326 domain-containing protein [Sinorhizobium sp. NFACC03]SDA39125.1 protein of unknown function [Sinorhizobium sp. NFACC03]